MVEEIDDLYRLSKEKEELILYALRDMERKLYSPDLRYSFYIKGNLVRVVAYDSQTGRVVFEVAGDAKNLDVLEKKWKDELDRIEKKKIEEKVREVTAASINEYSNRLMIIWNNLMGLWRKVALKKEKRREYREELLILKKELMEMEDNLKYTELYKRWRDALNLAEKIEVFFKN